ncbi:MAG: PDZ domain-containing protein, partial [Sphingobacteriales bacterium]
MSNKIGIGIITYNAPEKINQSAFSVPTSVRDFVIVNDGNPYDQSFYPDHAYIIQHTENQGVSKSKNDVLKYLLEKGCEHIFIMEDDVIIKDNKKRDRQEIVIKRNGDKDSKVVIEFKGDSVLLNGKSLIEFKDDAISINNRVYTFKQIEKDFEGYGRDMERFGKEMERFGKEMELSFRGSMSASGPFLGVITEKVEGGARIEEIVKESAASKSDLKVGDVITKVNDKKVNGPAELSEILGSFKPKQEVKIHYKRDGKDKSTKVSLMERIASTYTVTGPRGSARSLTVPPKPPVPPAAPRGGINVEEFAYNFSQRPKLGLKIQDIDEGSGVKVLEVEEGSAAAAAGLKKDDVITEIGTEKVSNTDEARFQLMANGNKAAYNIVAKRNNAEMKFEVKIPKKLKTAN